MNCIIFLLITVVVSDTINLRCGTNYTDAISRCGTECASRCTGEEGVVCECDTGESCWDIPDDESLVTCTPAPTMAPTTAPPKDISNLYKEWWLWIAVGIVILIILVLCKLISGDTSNEDEVKKVEVNEEVNEEEEINEVEIKVF